MAGLGHVAKQLSHRVPIPLTAHHLPLPAQLTSIHTASSRPFTSTPATILPICTLPNFSLTSLPPSPARRGLQLTTPLTLLEAGFNISHTKDVIRLLRNRGVIAALSLEEKVGSASLRVYFGLLQPDDSVGLTVWVHRHCKHSSALLLPCSLASPHMVCV